MQNILSLNKPFNTENFQKELKQTVETHSKINKKHKDWFNKIIYKFSKKLHIVNRLDSGFFSNLNFHMK